MGARDDVHAKGWDPTKDGALVPRTLGRAASWATSGWHFVRCAMEYARATTDYCVGHARNFRVHSHLPSFSENLVVRSPRVSRFTVNKKAQSVYSSTPTLGSLGCRGAGTRQPATRIQPATAPAPRSPAAAGWPRPTAGGPRAVAGPRSAARLVVYAGRPSAVRDAFGRVRRALDAARRTAETNVYTRRLIVGSRKSAG